MDTKMNSCSLPMVDLMGIGIGPFNLGLAALSQPIKQLKSVYFEKMPQFNWHPGLLLPSAELQVPFLADLVSLADPTSPYSFLNYLRQQERMYKFYFRENFHLSRNEYNHYCQWVCNQLTNVNFNHRVVKVDLITTHQGSLFEVSINDTNQQQIKRILSKHIVIGVGTEPYIPKNICHINSLYVRHTAHYLEYQKQFQNVSSICVIGSGQSAAEVVLELLNDYERYPRNITWITRSRGFFPMEYSKLGLEHFSPDYMQHFYELNQPARKKSIDQQDLMYKGISQKTIAAIYDKIYELTIANKSQPLTLLSHTELKSITEDNTLKQNQFKLHLSNWQLDNQFDLACDAVILGTGYQVRKYDFLSNLSDLFLTDTDQGYDLNSDFSVKTTSPIENKIFLQNNSHYSHGVGSSDLGLGCYRNSIILNTITNSQKYPIAQNNVFQQFGMPGVTRGIKNEYDNCRKTVA